MPQRTCVSCRKKAEKRDLVRFVVECSADESPPVDGKTAMLRLAGDVSQTLPGRGAYCHAEPSCLRDQRLLSALSASLGRAARSRGEQSVRIVASGAAGREVEEMLERMLATKPRQAKLSKSWEKLSKIRASWQVVKPSSEKRGGMKPLPRGKVRM